MVKSIIDDNMYWVNDRKGNCFKPIQIINEYKLPSGWFFTNGQNEDNKDTV